MLPIILNLCLGIFKYICGCISGLVSISADAANNLTDALTSCVTALGVKFSSTLGGKRHENGHGRIEWLVGIVVSCSVVLVGWEALRDSIGAIRNPSEPVFNVLILVIMLISIGIKVMLFRYNTNKSKENNSSAYKAAAVDCISDAVSTSAVTVSFVIDSMFHIHMDGWCGLVVSLFIIYNGLKSFSEISKRVMGEVTDEDMKKQLEHFVLEYGSEIIATVVDLQLLDYGYERYGAFLTVRARPDVDKIKFLQFVSDLKSAIYKEFGYIATIQPEIPLEQLQEKAIRETIQKKLREIDDKLQLADSTRMSEGKDMPQAVLHIRIPFEYNQRERELYQKIEETLKNESFSYSAKLFVGRSLRRGRRQRNYDGRKYNQYNKK